MADRIGVSFCIQNKPDIEEILGSSDLIPEKELHVLKETNYAKKLSVFGSEVSVALVARNNRKYNAGPGYTIGFVDKARVVFNDIQAKPLMLNHEMVQREKKEFRKNQFYTTYEIEVINPPVDLFEFFRIRGTLAPYATPYHA